MGTGAGDNGIKPLRAILFAQATNGLLLPVIALFLLWVMNRPQLLGEHRSGWLSNLLGGLIVVFVTGLGSYTLITAFL